MPNLERYSSLMHKQAATPALLPAALPFAGAFGTSSDPETRLASWQDLYRDYRVQPEDGQRVLPGAPLPRMYQQDTPEAAMFRYSMNTGGFSDTAPDGRVRTYPGRMSIAGGGRTLTGTEPWLFGAPVLPYAESDPRADAAVSTLASHVTDDADSRLYNNMYFPVQRNTLPALPTNPEGGLVAGLTSIPYAIPAVTKSLANLRRLKNPFAGVGGHFARAAVNTGATYGGMVANPAHSIATAGQGQPTYPFGTLGFQPGAQLDPTMRSRYVYNPDGTINPAQVRDMELNKGQRMMGNLLASEVAGSGGAAALSRGLSKVPGAASAGRFGSAMRGAQGLLTDAAGRGLSTGYRAGTFRNLAGKSILADQLIKGVAELGAQRSAMRQPGGYDTYLKARADEGAEIGALPLWRQAYLNLNIPRATARTAAGIGEHIVSSAESDAAMRNILSGQMRNWSSRYSAAPPEQRQDILSRATQVGQLYAQPEAKFSLKNPLKYSFNSTIRTPDPVSFTPGQQRLLGRTFTGQQPMRTYAEQAKEQTPWGWVPFTEQRRQRKALMGIPDRLGY